jgi:tetratricopeptide (TPR) repeat protein
VSASGGGRTRWLVAWLTAALLMDAGGAAADRAARARAADSLHHRALECLMLGTLDARRDAMGELEQASLLAPGDHTIWLDYGRLCLEVGQRKRGRDCYEHAQRAAPEDAEAYVVLGRAWTWEWLNSFDAEALSHAERSIERATRLDPGRAATWGMYSALLLSRGRMDPAERAALHGIAADPAAWDPLVALGCAAWRRGESARADSAFRAARARVPEALRERFVAAAWADDRGRIAADPGTIPDPDLTTPENEAELDYLTRLGLALLLFRDAHGLHWDMRSELFVRYGPPASVDVNPLGSPLSWHFPRIDPAYLPPGYVDTRPPPLEYPYDMQAWAYPELGIFTQLWDRSLNQTFELPPVTEDYADPRPNPMLLAARPDLIALGGGRGVFRTMPPGSRPVPAEGQVARFPSASGALLLAHVATLGEPTDNLSGAWAVVAADGRVIARDARPMSPSACDPAAQRVAEFSIAVPPGEYFVDMSVSGSGGRRGLVRFGATVAPPIDSLDLSDLVLVCGPADPTGGSDAVQIEPNLERRVAGDEPLAAYFEMNHLKPGSDGRARFLYTYSLYRIERDGQPRKNAQAAYQASREEEYEGTLRRQFITVPIRSIKPGTYDLRVQVRDLVSGSRAAVALRFDRE